MACKSMLLGILLVPLAIVCSDAKDKRIQQLEEDFFQKELELSNLGKMILEKDEFLASFGPVVKHHINTLVNREVKKIEKKDGRLLTEEEKNKIETEVCRLADEFLFGFFVSYEQNENIDGRLVDGLFRRNEDFGCKEFESLKFYLIMATFEREVIIGLVKKYEKCINELLALKMMLESTQK